MTALLQLDSGDVDFSSHGLRLVTDPGQEAAQKLKNRIKFIQGSWFLDTRLGLPYLQVVFIKGPDMGTIQQMFRKGILSVPRIVSTAVQVSLDKARKLSMSFTAKIDTGQVITGGINTPFIVSP